MNGYQLLDSGDGRKWERFGEYILNRPSPTAVWRPSGKIEADATFSRDGGNKWTYTRKLPPSWTIELEGILLKIAPTEFGHLGVFPEHAKLWESIPSNSKVLNLFAYSGGATLAAAKKGCSVCHVDASKGIIEWAKENAALNQLEKGQIRWIVDDAIKFLKREVKRGSRYDAIILDPPSFGRGAKGEVFKIERDLYPLLEFCVECLSDTPKLFVLTCHTPGFTPTVLSQLLGQFFEGKPDAFEMMLESKGALSIPSGSAAMVQL